MQGSTPRRRRPRRRSRKSADSGGSTRPGAACATILPPLWSTLIVGLMAGLRASQIGPGPAILVHRLRQRICVGGAPRIHAESRAEFCLSVRSLAGVVVNALERARARSHCEQCWGRLSSNRAGNPARVSRVFESTRRPSLLLCDFLACAQNTGTKDGSVGHNPALISRRRAENGMRVHSARSQACAASLFPLRFRRDVTLICRGLPKPVD